MSTQIKPAAKLVYPMAAIVGQDEMKLALLLNAINPLIGGVLIMGHRGTGKSTVVRALADLLPKITAVAGCIYRCDPTDEQALCVDCRTLLSNQEKFRKEKLPVRVVDLPLGATEDRVCGAIDIEQALKHGVKNFEPGLLARANRGFLYVDEVNLLEDHLVDILLDVAATGVNKIEREGMSVEHPARFVLVGSGNPEEGDLRPQLLDRFGLFIEVKTETDMDRRVEIVQRREIFDRAPESLMAGFAEEQKRLRARVARAARNAVNIKVDRRLLTKIAQLCSELNIDGHRGELTITRAARSLAAFENRRQVNESDVKRVSGMSLQHRLRRDGLTETGNVGRIEDALDKVFSESIVKSSQRGSGDSTPREQKDESARPRLKQFDTDHADSGNGNSYPRPNGAPGTDTKRDPSTPAIEPDLPKLQLKTSANSAWIERVARIQSSRQTSAKKSLYDRERGRYSRATSEGKTTAIAFDATLRAAASLNSFSFVDANRSTKITYEALRYKLYKRKPGRLFIFAIDLSGSMAPKRLAQAKSVAVALLRRSYVERDSVAIVGFCGTAAELLLPPTRSVLRARRILDSVSVGGGTPLSAGLKCSLDVAKRAHKTGATITLLLFTDGGANVPMEACESSDRKQREQLIESELTQLGRDLLKAHVSSIVLNTHDAFRSIEGPMKIASLLKARVEPIRVFAARTAGVQGASADARRQQQSG